MPYCFQCFAVAGCKPESQLVFLLKNLNRVSVAFLTPLGAQADVDDETDCPKDQQTNADQDVFGVYDCDDGCQHVVL